MSTVNDIRAQLAEYLDGQAAWRQEKAEEYPDDARNQWAADGLRELAGYVRGLAGNDEHLVELTRLCDHLGLDVAAVMPSDPVTADVNPSQFRFHDPGEPVDAFLHRLVEGAWAASTDVEFEELDKKSRGDDQ